MGYIALSKFAKLSRDIFFSSSYAVGTTLERHKPNLNNDELAHNYSAFNDQ